MSDPIKFRGTADELIRKLVRAGDLSPAKQDDPEAIAQAIAQMKNILRGRPANDVGPAA